MKYSTSKTIGNEKLIINIRLDDECKNGHNDFSITGSGYEKQKNGKWHETCGGCCHDEILKFFPKFKPFVDLHLSTEYGVPMYATENGFYHLKNTGVNVAREFLRVSDEEISKLSQCNSKLAFTKMLLDMKILERWESEALQAISMLEGLTGETHIYHAKGKLIDKNIELVLSLSPDELEEMIKEAEEHEKPENVQKRLIGKQTKALERLIGKQTKALEERYKKDIEKIETEYKVKKAILATGLSLDNIIYYNHNNKLVFNWQNGTYDHKHSQTDFHNFLTTVDRSQLPDNIEIDIKY